ncbi:MAG TPA: WD40 repeat domain-containing protein [Gemmataceae bacterium]|jgi:WD40 repeat protein|nr:WD40 repeat domain-containing protein [Gemmataceae bacterium]
MPPFSLLLPQVVLVTLFVLQSQVNPESTQNPQPPPLASTIRLDSLGDPLPPPAVARFGTVRLQHPSEVISVRFSPDGKSLIAAGETTFFRDRQAREGFRFWDPNTGKLQRKLGGFIRGPGRLGLSPDGKLLATVSDLSVTAVAEVETGKILYQIRWAGGSNIFNTSFSADGKMLAVKGTGSQIQLWDALTGDIVKRISSNGGLAISYSPDGKTLATTGKEAIYLWDPVTGKEIWHFDMPDPTQSSGLQFSHDGKLLAAGVDHRSGVWILEAHTGKLIRQWEGHDGRLQALAFSPDDAILATGMDGHLREGRGKGVIRLWDVATGKLIRELPGHDERTNSLDFSPDGKILASGGDDHLVRLWDPKTGAELFPRPGHQAEVETVAYSPDGKVLASSGHDGAIKFWRWQTDQALQTYRESNGLILSITYSPDGALLATGSSDGLVRIYDPAIGLKQTLGSQADRQYIYAVAFHPNGKFLVSAGLDYTRLWDLATAKDIRHLDVDNRPGEVQSAVLSPDGKILATGRFDGTVQLVEVDTGKLLRTLSRAKHPSRVIAFHPNGRILALAGKYDPIQLIDIYTGNELIRYASRPYESDAIAFSPDGLFLVTIDSLTDLVIWEALTGKEVMRLKGHEDYIHAVAFAPDGKTVTSAGHDRSLLVWDATGLGMQADAKTVNLSMTEQEKLWIELASTDPLTACRAIWRLRASPTESAHFLDKHLIAAPTVDPKLIAKWIGDLQDDRFAVRDKATEELTKLGISARPALQESLASSTSGEVRRRCKELLERIKEEPLTAEYLRELRAMAVLEYVDNPNAQRVLAKLAQGGAGARITRLAQDALSRKKIPRAVP